MNFGKVQSFFLNEIKHDAIPLMVFINYSCFSFDINTYLFLFLYYEIQIF